MDDSVDEQSSLRLRADEARRDERVSAVDPVNLVVFVVAQIRVPQVNLNLNLLLLFFVTLLRVEAELLAHEPVDVAHPGDWQVVLVKQTVVLLDVCRVSLQRGALLFERGMDRLRFFLLLV